jgi:magnesium chelatase family protein
MIGGFFMTVNVSSIGLKGMEGYRVQVQVKISTATESMVIVGLPDASVKESKERVLAAISQFGVDVTDRKIVVNLSPSEQKKNGPLFDLAMAIAALKELKVIKDEIPTKTAFIGALALDGAVERADGMLAAIISAHSLGFERVYLPFDSTIPMQLLQNLDCIVVQHVEEVVQHLQGQGMLSLLPPLPSIEPIPLAKDIVYKDFCHIIGHEQAKRALEIAAAGEHNVLMSGPPGCGKSLLAESFPSILPAITAEAQLEVMSLYQLAKETFTNQQVVPFRHPHHSASSVAIIGGGSNL